MTVYDIQDTTGEFGDDVDYIQSQCVLMGRWEVSSSGIQPQMIEWSVGVEGSSPGLRMMEPLWRDVTHENVAIFTTESSPFESE